MTLTHTLHFKKFGQGKNIWIAFHGFGQDASVFEPLTELLPEATVYSIDLFFHGKSEWNFEASQTLEPKVWKEIFNHFLTDNQIDNFHLIAYSIGAKTALQTVFDFSNRIKNLWLIAPEGIKANFWYQMATATALNRAFFKLMMFKINFLAILEKLYNFKIISSSIFQFFKSQVQNADIRKKIYKTWILYRNMKPNIDILAKIIQEKNIQTRFFIGKHDQIITRNHIEKLTKRLPNAQIHLCHAAHHQLLKACFIFIKKNETLFGNNL